MGSRFLIDTNIIIEFLGGKIPESGSYWVQQLIDKEEQAISIINKIELLGFNGSETEMKVLKEFVEICEIIPLTDEVANETINLRIKHRIKLPDAVIAATAKLYSLGIVTRNVSDFNSIEKIHVINPHNINPG
jgi:hypothetical protein